MFICTQHHSSCSWRAWDWCVEPRIGIKDQGNVCWAKDGHTVPGMGVMGFGWVWRGLRLVLRA